MYILSLVHVQEGIIYQGVKKLNFNYRDVSVIFAVFIGRNEAIAVDGFHKVISDDLVAAAVVICNTRDAQNHKLL